MNTPRNTGMSLVRMLKILISKKKFLLLTFFAFTIVGLFAALVAKKEFTARASFLPQESNEPNFSGGLGGLASLAGGISGLARNSNELNPMLYPKIISSIRFSLKLLDAPITVAGSNVNTTYRKYFEHEFQPSVISKVGSLPKTILKSIKGEDNTSGESDSKFVSISRTDKNHFQRLEKQISLSVNENEGIIYLSVTMPEPLMAAQMLEYCQDLLQAELISFQIKNAKTKLDFIQERYDEKKASFEKIQSELAQFQDENIGLSTAVSQSKLESIRSEYDIAFSIYKEMAAQLEEAKLKVSTDTPVFSILEEVTVPLDKSYPNRVLILFLFMFLGLSFGMGWVFIRYFYSEIKKQF